jgi:SOS-response transcriptional repressor LexA
MIGPSLSTDHLIRRLCRERLRPGRRGYGPTLRGIGEAAELASTSSVSHQLSTLQRKGFLRRIAGTRGLRPGSSSALGNCSASESAVTLRRKECGCRIAGLHRAVARISTCVLTVALTGTTLQCRPEGVAYMGTTEAVDVRAGALRRIPAMEEP